MEVGSVRFSPGPDGTFCAGILWGAVDRLVGLLGTRRQDAAAHAIALMRCSSVHTFGMRYALDIALVSREGLVLRSRRGVGPGRMVGAWGAWLALERPSSMAPWPKVGGHLMVLDGNGRALVRGEEVTWREVP